MSHFALQGTRLCRSGDTRGTQGKRRKTLTVQAGLGDDLKKMLDNMAFEKWAPKSSRAWRLGQGAGPREPTGGAEPGTQSQASIDEQFIDSLNARISQMGSVRDSFQEDNEPSPLESFEGASDDELARRFNSRLEEVSSAAPDDSVPLTGQLLRELVYAKYGKQYDLSIVRREVAGITVVALNVMWVHLDQQSFPMNEAQYMDKLGTIAEYLRAWKQEDTVRKFLLEPPKSKRGLPSRPVTGNAVSIRLNLEPSIMAEWFSK